MPTDPKDHMWKRETIRAIEVVFLGLTILLILVRYGPGFGPYWDAWLFYNRAKPWSDWLASWWRWNDVPPLYQIDKYFPDAHRHPPFMEIGGGFCNAVFAPILGELGSCRLFVELFTTLWLCSVYVYLRARINRMAGLLGVLLFLGSPRFMVHGVRFGADGLVAALYGLSILAFTRWHWDPNTIYVVFALMVASLLTKIQGLYLIPLFLAWIWWSSYRTVKEKGLSCRISPKEELHRAISLVLKALVIAIVLWPALWRRIPDGVMEYYHFIKDQIQIAVLYYGVRYDVTNPPPTSYPWGFTLAALPLSLIIPLFVRIIRYSVFGLDSLLERMGRLPMIEKKPEARVWGKEEVLLWVAMLFPLWVSSRPEVPKFDGIRLLLPAYMPMIIIAAIEITEWWEWMMIRVPRYLWGPMEYTAFACLGYVILMPTTSIYPLNLCYYSPLVGGVYGAKNTGFDLDYLGMSMHMLNPTLAMVAKPGDVLLVRGGNAMVYTAGREGWTPIPEGVKVGRMEITPALLEIPGNIYAYIGSRYSDETWEDRRILKECSPPLAEVSYGGVRIFSLHQIPRELIKSMLIEQKQKGVANQPDVGTGKATTNGSS